MNIVNRSMAIVKLLFLLAFDFLNSIINRLIGIAPRNRQENTEGLNTFKL